MAECAYNFDEVMAAFTRRDYAHILQIGRLRLVGAKKNYV
jgi:hypothetical protein